MLVGIVPVNMLLATLNTWRFPPWQASEGNSPKRELLDKSSTTKLLRLEISLGRGPDSMLLKR
jgi:hypothetical protein